MRIRVFHNNHTREAWVHGYHPEHTVTEVFAYDHRDGDGAPVHGAFELFNVGGNQDFCDPPDERALGYRARGNRSLCKGDVVAVEDELGTHFYAFSATGIELICPPRIAPRKAPGTTPWQHVHSGDTASLVDVLRPGDPNSVECVTEMAILDVLTSYNALYSDDEAKHCLELTCGHCEAVLCDVEAGDGMDTLVRVALDHHRSHHMPARQVAQQFAGGTHPPRTGA